MIEKIDPFGIIALIFISIILIAVVINHLRAKPKLDHKAIKNDNNSDVKINVEQEQQTNTISNYSKIKEHEEKSFGTDDKEINVDNRKASDYIITNGFLEKYIGKNLEVLVPETVKIISENAFNEFPDIKCISIPDSVIKIEKNTFSNCKNLTRIYVPESLLNNDYDLPLNKHMKLFTRPSNVILDNDQVNEISKLIAEVREVDTRSSPLQLEELLRMDEYLDVVSDPYMIDKLKKEFEHEVNLLAVLEDKKALNYLKSTVQYEIGMHYYNSSNTERNRNRCLNYFEIAAENGNTKAKQMINTLSVSPKSKKLYFDENTMKKRQENMESCESKVEEQNEKVISMGTNEDSKLKFVYSPEFVNLISISCFSHGLVGLRRDGTVMATGSDVYNKKYDINTWKDIKDVFTGCDHTVGLTKNGTLVSVGDNLKGECDTACWENIIDVACGLSLTLGLKKDGTVLATGDNVDGSCNTSDWHDIVSISAEFHSVGLNSRGKVFATGNNRIGQCDVENWSNIVCVVAANESFTVALDANGKVFATGNNAYGQCNVSSWTDIEKIYAGNNITVGIRKDGTVVTTAESIGISTEDWTDITDISIGNETIVGLKANGTVVYSSKNIENFLQEEWFDIKAIFSGYSFFGGLKKDGTIVTAGGVNGMYNFKNTENILSISESRVCAVALYNNGKIMIDDRNSYYNKFKIDNRNNIAAIDVEGPHVVGLTIDGSVFAVSNKKRKERDVINSWKSIKQIKAGSDFTVGLKHDGTVIAIGNNEYGQCNVDNWKGIVEITTGPFWTVGLHRDGSVIATGANEFGECDVDSWRDIISIAATSNHTIGLKENGDVIATKNYTKECRVNGWENIVSIAAGRFHIIGLTGDGKVICSINNDDRLYQWSNVVSIGASGNYSWAFVSD